jgi:hypothetical protein
MTLSAADRLAILEVITRADEAASRRDAAGYVALFAPDAVLALAVDPYRVGKPLFGPLAGCHGARRGTYRIVYRIDEATRTVHVLDIDHRAEIYRAH